MTAEEVEVRCPACGSTHLHFFEAEYETGVYAPDGYAERWLWRGFRCEECGAVEEE